MVVLVHGMVVSSRYMAPLASHLAPYARIYAVDLPGYGKSHKPKSILDLPQLAGAVAAWMDALAIEKAHLLGNSFGCQVLAEFALRYPHRIERLVFVAPTVDPAHRTYWQQGWRFAWNTLGVPPSLVWVVLVDYVRAGLPRAFATIKMVMNDRIEEKLPYILAPTLVVRGEHDKLVPQRWAEEVVRLLPNGRLVVIRGTGHVPNYATPAEVVRVLRPFLGL